jgi:ABC-type lipoprotein release transport system permease subunit
VGKVLLGVVPQGPPGQGEDLDFGYRWMAVFVMAVLALTMVATYIPARRAARVDPSEALRCE